MYSYVLFYMEYEVRDFIGRRYLIPLWWRTKDEYQLILDQQAIKQGLSEQFERVWQAVQPLHVYPGNTGYIQQRMSIHKRCRPIVLFLHEYLFSIIQSDPKLSPEQNFNRLSEVAVRLGTTNNPVATSFENRLVVRVMTDAGVRVQSDEFLVARIILP